MRYSILGFNQEKLLEIEELNMNDIMLLAYIWDVVPAMKMEHLIGDDEELYVWLSHKKIMEDLPILHITKDTLKRRLQKLISLGLLKTKRFCNTNIRGSKSYYAITDKTVGLRYEPSVSTYTSSNDQVDTNTRGQVRPGVSTYTSNNKLNNNSKLNNDSNIKKDIPVLSRGKRNSIVNNRKTTFKDCFNQINNYTEDEELRKCLKDYLTLRIEMLKDKPMKATQWKYMMEKLDSLQEKSLPGTTKADIVKNSIERQYPTFYPLDGKFSNKKSNNNSPMWQREGIPHDGRYDNEDHSLSGEVF